MTQVTLRPAYPLVAAFVAAMSFAPPAAGQDTASAGLAKELVQALEKAQLDAIAAQMPDGNDTFVAAMYIPGQLLVVAAQYAAPALLREKIDKKQYRDVYVDLNSASRPNTRQFIEDLNADGLVQEPEENLGFDTFDNGGKTIGFDGDWRKSKLSEDEYRKTFAQANDSYTKMLTALLQQAKKGGGTF
jgi:hypothetical protein